MENITSISHTANTKDSHNILLEDDGISDEAFSIIDIFINCFLINFISLFGIAGNIINLMVLSRHEVTTDTTNIILISLSVANLIFDVTMLLRKLDCLISLYDPALAWNTGIITMFYVFPWNRYMAVNDHMLVALVSLERFIAVWFPFSVGRIFTPRKIKITIVCIYLFNLIICIPVLFSFDHLWIFHPLFNETIMIYVPSAFQQKNEEIMNIFYLLVSNLVISGIPWVLVPICSIGIMIKLIQTGRARKLMVKVSSKDKDPDEKVLKMLVVVSMLCLFTNAPSSIVDAYYGFFNKDGTVYKSGLYNMLIYFKDLLYTVNASVNFLIYVTMSNKFSRTYKSLFCSWRCAVISSVKADTCSSKG